jgi:hypothetical protein
MPEHEAHILASRPTTTRDELKLILSARVLVGAILLSGANDAVARNAIELGFRKMKPKASAGLAALAIIVQLVTGCSDQERFRGRTTEQVKQACDPQHQTPEECSRTLDK